MLAGRVSVVLNAISITREAERTNPKIKSPATKKEIELKTEIGLTKALRGPARAIGLEHVMDCYVVWKFADNIEGAKKFLIDYTMNFREAFKAGSAYDFPCFPKTVPDLEQLLANDSQASPKNKYVVLGDVLNWATNVGYPGYANAAIDEIFNTWVLNVMFAKAASGSATPEEALKEGVAASQRIFAKWRERGLV
jgi:multiple sugar transport system substrate-binding protein